MTYTMNQGESKQMKKQTVNTNHNHQPLTKKYRIKYETETIRNMLDAFKDALIAGFNEERWSMATELYRKLSNFLYQRDREILGELWRNSYVASDLQEINDTINSMKQRVVNY